MKRKWGLIVCFFLAVMVSDVFAGFDDVLKEVLLETSRPIGAQEYVFSPGDVVINKTNYAVYYSGHEVVANVATLLFTVFEAEKTYMLKFPNPDIIQIKDVKIKILSFDNTALRLQLIKTQSARY